MLELNNIQESYSYGTSFIYNNVLKCFPDFGLKIRSQENQKSRPQDYEDVEVLTALDNKKKSEDLRIVDARKPLGEKEKNAWEEAKT